MKIVINRCFGGYGLSEAAYKELGLEWDKYGYKDVHEPPADVAGGSHQRLVSRHPTCYFWRKYSASLVENGSQSAVNTSLRFGGGSDMEF